MVTLPSSDLSAIKLFGYNNKFPGFPAFESLTEAGDKNQPILFY
jgi:hypothetical protein